MKKNLTKRLFSIAMAAIMIVSSASSVSAVPVNENGNAFNQTAAKPDAAPTHADNPALTIYVATTGNDTTGNGSLTKPYASIEKARDHIRALPSKPNGDIKVQIADGFYYTDHTIEFTNQDSGTENCTIYYEAAPGAKPIFSGGPTVKTGWTEATEVNWLTDGLKAYKTSLTYNDKLRAIYVDGVRAQMTERKTANYGGNPTNPVGDYSIDRGSAEWAWISAPADLPGNKPTLRTGVTLKAQLGLSSATRNPRNIEMYSGSTWVMSTVTIDTITDGADGAANITYQMPYAAIAQLCGGSWGCAYGPTKAQTINNVYEWLSKGGEFYFDQAGSTLYYIPRNAAEETKLKSNTAQVVMPKLETIINVQGGKLIWDNQAQATTKINPADKPVENITFSGITLAYTGWNLSKVANSSGYATVQGCTVFNVLSYSNWHDDVYRSYDVTPSAFLVNDARNVNFMDGAVRNTGSNGLHYQNNVADFEVTGNYIGEIGGSGLIIGHPQHVYENDIADGNAKYGSEDAYQVKRTEGTTNIVGASPSKEKFANGTEKVPVNVLITNNYFPNNCYFFAGDLPVVTFFTQNMHILNNFVYSCPYGGMNIGWGWCNFDGTNGAQLPGKPTTTSRGNFVNFNRIENVARVLQDTGCLYSLGQQGNGTEGGTDYSQYSEFNNNFLNGNRDSSNIGTRMISGIHTDEGSAYMSFSNNVLTNLARGTYEFNNFARKHDLHAVDGFANRTASQTGAPNTSIDQYANANSIWPLEGHNVVLNSGLTDAYTNMVDASVLPAVNHELASNVSMRPDSTLDRRGLLAATDEVWIAPKDTTTFKAGATMTKAAGNTKTITVPETVGEYTMYIRRGGNTVETSAYTIYVEGIPMGDPANVSEGQSAYVSAIKPLTLSLDTDLYKDFKLDNQAIGNGHEISTEKAWVLTATNKSTNANITIHFNTVITDANKLLTGNVTVEPGAAITLKSGVTLKDGNQLWIAGSGDSTFADVQKDWPNRSFAPGGSTTINAPTAPGTYVLHVANDYMANTARCSDATITVNNTSAFTSQKPTISSDDLWQKAQSLRVEKVFQDDAATLAKGIARLLWDDSALYVRIDVTDPDINVANGSSWLQDSVEVYLSEQNFKGSYSGTQGNQYRLTAEGKFSAKTTNNAVLYETKTTSTGYTAFLTIPLTTKTALGRTIGFDVQINDATTPANDRTGQISWSDPNCNGYSSSEGWGELLMTDPRVLTTDDPGLDLWLKADEGLKVDAENVVTSWTNQATNTATAAKEFTPSAATFKPVLKDSIYKSIYFDGTGGGANALRNDNFKDYTDSTAFTVITVSLPESNPNSNGDQSSAVWMPETGGWGGTFFTPGVTSVNMRLGSGASANGATPQSSNFTRTAPKILTTDAFVFDAGTHTMYENGVQKVKNTSKNSPMARSSAQLNIGGTSSTSNAALFKGEIAEVLMFNRALAANEIQAIQQYVNDKYLTAKEITSIKLAGVDGVIDGTNITVTLPENTDVSALTPEIEFSGASIDPTGVQNFSNPVVYTVTALDGTTKVYTVSVKMPHRLTVVNGTGTGSYLEKTTVNIKANAPAVGQVFDKWVTADGGTFANASNPVTTYTMPAKVATVTATYKDIVATGIKLDKTSVAIKTKQTIILKATLAPANTKNKAIVWKSSNSRIAKVDAYGKVTGVAAGKATITAATVNGKQAACTVTVTNAAVAAKSVSLNQQAVVVKAKKSLTLKAKVSPANTTNKKLKWKSSKPKIAKVNSKGKVTGLKKGKAVITATTANGKKITCTVYVNGVSIRKIKLNKTKASIAAGKRVKLKVTVTPKKPSEKKIKWTSSNRKIATVSASGTVTIKKGVKKGSKVTITATSRLGNKKAKCVVRVK